MGWLGEIVIKIEKRRKGIIKLLAWKVLFGKSFSTGKDVIFYPGCHLVIEHTGAVKVGQSCFFNHNCSITSLGKIEIGDNCIFGEGVKIYDHNHKNVISNIPFKKQGYDIGKVTIGNNVWVGSETVILSNVSIGDNVVIAAGSIVSKSIASNSVFIQKRECSLVSK